MTTPAIVARFAYQFGATDWRSVDTEYWDTFESDAIDYTVIDGQIVRTVETVMTYDSGLGFVPANIVAGPGYLYADGTFREDPIFRFQKTHIVTKDYSAIDLNSYEVTIDDYDVLRDKHTITHEKVDGKMPLAPTIGSALSNLIQRPIVGTLDDNCGWVESTLTINSAWAENEQELDTIARRAAQRANAVVRTTTGKANPLIRLGATVHRIDAKRAIDAREIVTGKTIKHDTATGGSTMDLTTEWWPR